MGNSSISTTSAQTLGGMSLLKKQISAPATQASAQAVLPYINNLPAGKYSSEIVDVSDAVQNGVIVGIDCIHKLTFENGNITFVKFRFFEPIDTSALIQVLASYGLSGNIGNALMGLKEEVDIAPRPNSARYVYIAHRAILNVQNGVATATSNNSTNASTKATNKNRVGSSYFGSKHASLSSQAPKPSLTSSKKNFNNWDDDEEVDDDYLTEED